MAIKKGNLSINSENIFPIIKKWLYSDHDIFYRELISNGCDAVTKLKKLSLMGECELPDDYKPEIHVFLNPENKSITISDNGLGMTADEVDEYINQIAFSGAQDFLNKYKDKANEDQIIGHFGLGFYSAFMVADTVVIETLSYQKDAKPVHWESEGGQEFIMEEGCRTEFGTSVTLYLNEDSVEFSNEYRAREIIDKYCSFMPVEIYLDLPVKEDTVDVTDAAEETASVSETVPEEASSEAAQEKEKEPEKEAPKPLNDIHPLWTKHPNECTEEEYKEFYRKVFHDYKEPLFWIHLNMDYPFNLKGILYFPRINMEYESIEGVIKLYNNQVFIADNIKEVIPEFLMLLKGVIDCPDLPLNVSRSALQNDGFVKKISDYITKKVADKLSGMCRTDRETYEKYWDDISPFIKFGCLKDEKFDDKMKDSILYKNLDGKYLTLPDCLEENKEKHENTVFYVTDEKEQSQYINLFREAGLDAVLLPHNIDAPFITHTEQKNKDLHFVRIDSDLASSFKEEMSEEDQKSFDALTELFQKTLNKDKLTVKAERLKNESVASMITVSEESRRMQEMMKMYSMGMDPDLFGPAEETLVLNVAHPLVKLLSEQTEGAHTEDICRQLYDLALLAHGPLSPEEMTAFVKRSNDLMLLLAEK